MSTKITIEAPLNRAEGDLEVRVEIEDGRVVNAWCSGTMYRGFENLMIGRGPLDGLVITPRVCGICSTSHLTAAVLALDMICGITPPPDAVRVRNLALMAEHIQSDVRQAVLMFNVDFVNSVHAGCDLYDEARRRYEPFKGETIIEAIRETKRVLEIVAILGGQWPHSSFMVPGGIASNPGAGELLRCRHLLQHYRSWYERRILGCTVERWSAIQSQQELEAWLEESPAQKQSDLGFYIRYARAIGLPAMGRGHGSFLSYGSLDQPAAHHVIASDGTLDSLPGSQGAVDQLRLVKAGWLRESQLEELDHWKIREHIDHSWYVGPRQGLHPMTGQTTPYATGQEGEKYSWAKAPRYAGQPAETGPLAEALVARNPLFTDLVAAQGPNAWVRQLARLVRPASLLPTMERWLTEIRRQGEYYNPPGEILDGEGVGLIQATRGALGHWVQIHEHKIQRYQIITPTAWNASPRDDNGVRGPLEEALIDTPIKDPDNPVELGHVVRSFDPCLVCTVHTVVDRRRPGRALIGMLR